MENEEKTENANAQSEESKPMVDVFHQEYRELNVFEKNAISLIKDEASRLLILINEVMTPANGREIALAKTNLEESVMWAVKGITK